ncbi:MAG: SRPBCC family protein [Methanothrix sp.]|nr:SRPBCC family protein [Methanothrix sp.]
MKINEKAPVIASGEVEVAADANIIWEMMATIDRWPEWNADVLSAALQGEIAPGSKFIWKAGRLTITSTILQADRPSILAWTGNTMGIKAIHIWQLVERDKKTIVRTEESWEGLLARLLPRLLQTMLKRSIDSGLLYLKVEAERRFSFPDRPASNPSPG